MSDLDFLEDDAILVELSDKVDKLEKNLRIGLGCDKPDAPEVCNKMSGGKKERKRPDGIKVSQRVGVDDLHLRLMGFQADIRILLLLEDLVRGNRIMNHPNFNTLPEEDRIELQAAYADTRQQLIQAGYTQQQLNNFLQQTQQGGRKSRKKRRKRRKSRRKTKKRRRSRRKKSRRRKSRRRRR